MSLFDFNDYVPKWTEDAACVSSDPELWFPKKGANGNALKAARTICDSCPVRDQCLEAALANPEDYYYGVRGGLTAKERMAIRRGVA